MPTARARMVYQPRYTRLSISRGVRRKALILPGVAEVLQRATRVWSGKTWRPCRRSSLIAPGEVDPCYRHAMPVMGPIESYRRPCSSGVGCTKITHMNRTVATSNSVNVSTTRTIDPRQTASQWPHRYPPALETNTLWAPGPRTPTIASAVAVITRRQRPATSHAPTSGPIGSRSLMSRQLRRQRSSRPRPRVADQDARGNYRGVAIVPQ
jgi:hypothetical protein